MASIASADSGNLQPRLDPWNPRSRRLFVTTNTDDSAAITAAQVTLGLTDGRNVVDDRAVKTHRVRGRFGEHFAQTPTSGEADERCFKAATSTAPLG
ncbi:hypothetical protein [Microbacterium oleivorans]|uniref:hypothetical protein n=1 Tax=Microbacterium oleivorans TaxID=273677 RepID=UPI0012B5C933|nr:hypothetical protein [Microbacterium oleivorans]